MADPASRPELRQVANNTPLVHPVTTTENKPSTASTTKLDEKEGEEEAGQEMLSKGQNKVPCPPTSTSSALPTDEDEDAYAYANADERAESTLKKPSKRGLNPLKRNPTRVPTERSPSREYKTGWASKLTFQWIQPLMATGYKRPLEFNDLWLVNPDRSCSILESKLKAAFEQRREAGCKRALVAALYDTFKFEFLLGGLCHFLQTVFQVIAPFLMRYLISFAHQAWTAHHLGGPAPPVGHGIGIVLGIVVLGVSRSLCGNHFQYYGMVVGGQCRAVLMAAIYDKTLRISGRARAGWKPLATPPPLEPSALGEKKRYEGFLARVLPSKNPNAFKGNARIASDDYGYTNGRIINLMSTDTYRIDQGLGQFHMLWCAPFGICFTLVLLVVNLTYSALAGFSLLVLAVIVLTRVARRLLRRRVAINKITDERVSLTFEILQAVRFIKLFGWETPFLDRIFAIRKRETLSIQTLLGTRNAINATSASMPIFSSMICFVVFFATNHPLDPAPVFSSLALFNGLRLFLNIFPVALGQAIDAISSMQRIEGFLLSEEAVDDFIWRLEAESAVEISNGNFTWEHTTSQDPDKSYGGGKAVHSRKRMRKGGNGDEKKAAAQVVMVEEGGDTDNVTTTAEQEPFKIKDINLTVGRDELVALIGSVGSGKSSLLAALAGDMRRTDGTVTVGANHRAFCPQYAWIQNTTLRDNVTFGEGWDPEWYEKVIDACALRPDFEALPNGDMTEIGERGITLSGGQKQRVNIARAIYFSKADFILLDDPLSAVDAHVGHHIMDNAICGLLQGKARILATHQLNVIHRCDRIVWVEGGRIIANDTYSNLMANDEAFRKLVAMTAVAEQGKKTNGAAEDGDIGENKSPSSSHRPATKSKERVALMKAEERATRSVSWGVYMAYLKAAGGYLVGPLLFFLLIISQGSAIMTGLWLAFWTAQKWHFPTGVYIGVYVALGICQALSTFAFAFGISIFGTRASRHMLQAAMRRVLRAPMSFFDTTPIGRITNRFSKDIDIMDNVLTDSLRALFTTLAIILSVFILIIVFFYYFAIALVPLCLIFYFTTIYYRASAREIKRLEAIERSFVFAKFSEAVAGVTTIRAYRLEGRFSNSARQAIDNMDSAYFLTFANQRWLGVRLDVIANLIILIVGLLVVFSRAEINPSFVGLVLSYLLSAVQLIQFGSRQIAEVDNNMNATERVHYYATQLEEEEALLKPTNHPPRSWPDKGDIVFKDIQMSFRKGLPLVLKGFSLHIKGAERIGVVGRTGAGKSSILNVLFRMVELSAGSITIDGIDISTISLQDLRSRLAIIPQDPALFCGTIRSNLDPFNNYTDLELWSALRQADLVGAVGPDDKAGRITLDSVVEEEGLNFSLGQRQLMALARALVRGSRIIACDEATSSVDFQTDRKIQNTMMAAFAGKTLICIAHRLSTIVTYDRVVVMDAGGVAEADSPLALFDAGGIFRGMCERSGIRREDFL